MTNLKNSNWTNLHADLDCAKEILMNVRPLAFASLLVLTACLEPQQAPELAKKTLSDFKIETVATNLNTPWSVAPLPAGGYIVTEKEGNLKRINLDGSIDEIAGTPTDIYTEQQAGLFDVVLAPDFENTGKLYLTYAYGDAGSNGTALISANLLENTLTNTALLFKASPTKDTASHFGGRLAILPDQSLILTLGEGFVYREAAQDKSSHLGKIVHLASSGQAHPDNPFINEDGAKPEIYSYGHRNIQGVYFDNMTGNLWASEHGPRGGDELNLIKAGENYGWPLATKGTDYTGARITPFTSLEDTIAPSHSWVPSIAPSGLTIYHGGMFPDWEGDALVGGLASKNLRRVNLDADTSVGEEILVFDLGARVRDVRVDLDGAILLVINTKKDMEAAGGQIIRILPKD